MHSLIPPSGANPSPQGDWTAPVADTPQPEHADSLIDVALIRNFAGFAVRSVQRHRRPATWAFASIMTAVAAAWLVLPRSYYAEIKLLAVRNVELPLLGNPARKVPTESDTPTRLASEVIMSRANLEAIANTPGLLDSWQRHRSPLVKVSERLRGWVTRHPQTHEDLVNALAWSLNSRLVVKVGEGTITIGVTWTDAQMAAQILQAAQENFLEQRHREQISVVTESIAILEQNATEAHDLIRGTLDSLARVRKAVTPREPSALVTALTRPRAPSGEVVGLRARLEGVQRTIADLEQFRSRRLAELQATLADQQNTYGAAHPVIANTRELIRSMGSDSPQLAQARREAADLRSQLIARGSDAAAPSAVSATDPILAAAALRSLDRIRMDSVTNENQVYDRARLRIAIQSYQDLLQRIDGARIELQTAQASFKYQYGVLTPAEVPTSALSPRLKPLAAGGLLLGALLAVFVSVALDIVGGRVVEPWQIERGLGLPVLGTVPRA